MSSSKLFQAIHVGDMDLSHRVVLAPMTRYRSTDAHVPGHLVPEYYTQRASTPGTLLITEGVFIEARAGGSANVPGIWNKHQINEWKKVTEAVHAKKSFIYCQLWALGRSADASQLAIENLADAYAAPSPIAASNSTSPRELTTYETREFIQLYATAASNAIEAGFDGVEVHGANGYIIDQFLQDVSNKRTDEYGGTVANRVRFAQEVVDAIVKRIGAKRTAIRVSPWGRFGDMRMQDPIPTFSHLTSTLLEAHPELAYVHVVEARIDGGHDRTGYIPPNESNDFIRDIIQQKGKGTKFISTGGYTRESGIEAANAKGDLIGYARSFLANPDLPYRLKEGIPLNKGNRETYYLAESPVGYIDYPFANEVPN